MGLEGKEEWGVWTAFLRTSWGVVRNAGPQIHPVPWRQISWVGLGPCLPGGFLGDSEEGLETSLVNSDSEDLGSIGRGSSP